MGIFPDRHGVHSPSWMHTLIRRTTPHRALVRNSLSSGVTTSARNMAAQQWCPPARGGLEEPVPDIRSGQSKFGKRGLLETSSTLWAVSTEGLLSATVWQESITQATRTVSCAQGKGTRSPHPNLAPRGWLSSVPGYYSSKEVVWPASLKTNCWANMAPVSGVEVTPYTKSV